jgi:hypothetical protein
MSRRVLIGEDGSGNFAFKTTLPGYDALLDDDQDAEKFSYNSAWSDMIQVHQVGISGVLGAPSVISVSYPDLGYVPYFDAKLYMSSVYWNDYNQLIGGGFRTTSLIAFAPNGSTSTIHFSMNAPGPFNQCLYVIYKQGMIGG